MPRGVGARGRGAAPPPKEPAHPPAQWPAKIRHPTPRLQEAFDAVHKYAKAHSNPRNPRAAAAYAYDIYQIQEIIDTAIFEIVPGGVSDLTLHLRTTLLQYLLDYFRTEDPHRFAVFDLLFSIDEEVDDLQRFRFRNEDDNQTRFGVPLVKTMYIHYAKHVSDQPQEKFLLALSEYSADFCVMFLTYAPTFEDFTQSNAAPRLVKVCAKYLMSQPNHISSTYRDNAVLRKHFCEESFPRLLEYLLRYEGVADTAINDLQEGLIKLLKNWKDKTELPDLSILGDDTLPKTSRRWDYYHLGKQTGVVQAKIGQIMENQAF
ncbi:unnamed protein product, partial [Mesorhabditis spiculigera]